LPELFLYTNIELFFINDCVTILGIYEAERMSVKSEELSFAIAIARDAHEGQIDKGGKPYIGHPVRVMNALTGINQKIVGILHDVVEDSNTTLEDIKHGGFSDEIINAIDAITKRDKESYEGYLDRVMGNRIATEVKIADMTDNMDMSRIPEPKERDWQRLRKYEGVLPQLKDRLRSWETPN